jgi:hypothetical protein
MLEGLTHLRILRFIDDPALSTRKVSELKKSPEYKVVFKDREGNATQMLVAENGGKLWGTITSRPNSAFELYPEAKRLFVPR